MSRLSPYIYCEDARKQADFYAKALGGEIVSVQTFENWPDASPEERSRVMHLVLKVGELQIFMADSSPIRSGNQIDLALELQSEAEARTVFERLSRDGPSEVNALGLDAGPRRGSVRSPLANCSKINAFFEIRVPPLEWIGALPIRVRA